MRVSVVWELFSFRNTWISIPAILLPGAEKPEYILIPEYPKQTCPKHNDNYNPMMLIIQMVQPNSRAK